MGKKEDKKRLLAQVEEAKQEYLHTCDVGDECYGRLDHQREEAIGTMEQSEGLINSIKHTPFSFKKDLKALSRERKKITDRSDLEKEQRATDRAAGIAAVMAIGAGGLGSLSFKDFLSDKFNVSDDDNGNNGIVRIIIIALILFVGIGYLIWKAVNSLNTAKKAELAYKETSQEALELQKHIANAEQNIIELLDTSAAIDRALHHLSQYRDGDFRKIPDSDQEELFTLVNMTQALSGILSQDI